MVIHRPLVPFATPPARLARCLWLCACVAVLLSTSQAAAQEAGSLGFKLGDNRGRLHPFVDLDTHWVTNPGRIYARGPSDLVTSGRVGLELDFPSGLVQLRGEGHAAYNRFWGLQAAGTQNLSNFSAQVGLEGTVNREGALALRPNASFLRSADPANQTLTQRLLHNVTQGALALDWTPGGGALLLTAGAGVFWDAYDAQLGVPPGALDNWRLLPEARVTWNFLPKTGLFVEGQGQLTTYRNATYSAPAAAGAVIPNINTRNFAASAGIAGAITHRTNALVKLGWGDTLMADGRGDTQTVIGAVEVNVALSSTGELSVGAARSLQPTTLFRYFALTRAFATYDQRLASHTNLRLRPSYAWYNFGPAVVDLGVARADRQLSVEASLAQGFAEWFVVSVIERLEWRVSNWDTAVGNAGYLTNDVLLRFDFRY